MPQDDMKLKEALEMATRMDAQQQEVDETLQRETQMKEQQQKQAKKDMFLKTLGMIESSGGSNFNHPKIQSGIHKGHKAAGTFGLMPNTITETLNRMRINGTLTPELKALQSLGPRRVKEVIESNPEIERQIADKLAEHVLQKQGDEEKAAYSWFQGHNLSPEEIEQRKYQDHDYVQKYRKFKKMLEQPNDEDIDLNRR